MVSKASMACISSQSQNFASFLPYTFNTPINLKLDDDNFLSWKQQVLAIVREFKLEGSVVSEKFKTPEDVESNIVNPEFLDYDQQDQSIVA